MSKIAIKNLQDKSFREHYFHKLAQNCESLELLLNICYNNGLIPTYASTRNKKDHHAYIALKIYEDNLTLVSHLIKIILDFPTCEFTLKSNTNLYLELSCDSSESSDFFTKAKEIIEKSTIENINVKNYRIIKTVYSIYKVTRQILDADIIFSINQKLYTENKCGFSIFEDKGISKLHRMKISNSKDIIDKLQTQETIKLPVLIFPTFSDLKELGIRLNETIYKEGEKNE